MTSILSATEDDFYAMPLPLAVYSWHKIGVETVVFIPEGDNPKLSLAKEYCYGTKWFSTFRASKERTPTFSQVIRLFGGALGFPKDEVLITSDADICVFGDYFKQFDFDGITIAGNDLTPEDQYPMCFIGMPTYRWREVFKINMAAQFHVGELINPIESDNVRGTQWCYDQWYAKKMIDASSLPVNHLSRANPGTQFATNRADRDGWHFDAETLVDAHLPRPLTDESNYIKAVKLFALKYPDDNLNWMWEYFNRYKDLC